MVKLQTDIIELSQEDLLCIDGGVNWGQEFKNAAKANWASMYKSGVAGWFAGCFFYGAYLGYTYAHGNC